MKLKFIFALVLYFIGLARIVDWFIFCNQNRTLKNENYSQFISKYENKFPVLLQPLFNTRPELATIISIFIFIVAGLIFINSGQRIFKILGITAFIFSFWNLFSLM